MRTNWYYRNKKVTKKWIIENFGRERTEAMLKEAKETFMYDSNIQNSFANGITIEFKL